jgi:hypothetical protein
MLACSAFVAERAAMWGAVEQEVGRPAVSAAQTLPADQQLAALLGDSFWGDCAPAVDAVVQQYFGCADAAAAIGGAGGCGCAG